MSQWPYGCPPEMVVADRLARDEDGNFFMVRMYGHHNERIMELEDYWDEFGKVSE